MKTRTLFFFFLVNTVIQFLFPLLLPPLPLPTLRRVSFSTYLFPCCCCCCFSLFFLFTWRYFTSLCTSFASLFISFFVCGRVRKTCSLWFFVVSLLV
jgi:hypothetical protein